MERACDPIDHPSTYLPTWALIGSSHSGFTPCLNKPNASKFFPSNFFFISEEVAGVNSVKTSEGLGMKLKYFQKASTVSNSHKDCMCGGGWCSKGWDDGGDEKEEDDGDN